MIKLTKFDCYFREDVPVYINEDQIAYIDGRENPYHTNDPVYVYLTNGDFIKAQENKKRIYELVNTAKENKTSHTI